MTRQEVEQTAFSAMSTGYNCAETILHMAISHFGLADAGVSTRIATCFGGGIGRSHDGMCGALSGSIMALGLAYGRDAADQPPPVGLDMAADFRKRFIARFGSSCCRELLDRFGPQQGWTACKRLVAGTAGMLHETLMEQRRSR
ncbi:C-GCAxxG-C-C family protein [Desulfovibrio sp. JY]|nr:C-GCAxxG-C-C family protein [Desulfovibrio sp. JY]